MMTYDTAKITEHDLNRLTSLFDHCPDDSGAVDRLENKFSNVEVIESAATPPNLITMNSVFRATPLAINHSLHTPGNVLKLVYSRKADIASGTISVFTPLGVELLGASVGDTVKWQGKDGKLRRMIIEEVVYQPEASGDWHL